MFSPQNSARVTAGDGTPLSFLCARILEKYTEHPSPPVTTDVLAEVAYVQASCVRAISGLFASHFAAVNVRRCANGALQTELLNSLIPLFAFYRDQIVVPICTLAVVP